MEKPAAQNSPAIGVEKSRQRAAVNLIKIDDEKIPAFVSRQRVTERGSLELETADGTFFVRVLAVHPDPDAAILGRDDEWDPKHVTYQNLNFSTPIHAFEHGPDTTHGMVQLPWVSMKPGTRYAVAVIADEHCFGEPETFTDESNDSTGGGSALQIKSLFYPVYELKSGTRTPAFATTVRIDGEQPLSVTRTGFIQQERLTILPRLKDEAMGKETGDATGVFSGLVEDDGSRATTKPLIIEDAPSSSPGAGTPESNNGLTTVVIYKTGIERVTRIKKIPTPNRQPATPKLLGFGDTMKGGDSTRSFGRSFSEAKTVFGETQETEVNTVTTTGNRGMAGAFQFRIVAEQSAD